MRICILTHTFPRFSEDTAAPFMDGVAGGIKNAGNEVYVLAPFSKLFKNIKRDYKVITYKYVFPDFLHKLGYSETLSDDKKLKILSLFLSPLMLLFGTIALYRLVKKERIDLINAHWILPNGFMACVVSVLTGVLVVSTLPGSDVYLANKNILFKMMARFATRYSRAVTSNSPQLLDDLASIYSRDEAVALNLKKKFFPIIYGVDPHKFKPMRQNLEKIRRELKVRKNQRVVLGVGRLVAKKGFRYLIEAAPLILKKHPNTVFVVTGEGEQKNILEELSVKLKVARNFRFPGRINYKDLVNYYNFADVFILPSIRDEEGNLDDQSVSVVEAMACGKPVITTNFPGYSLVVSQNKNGYLVDEKNPGQISAVVNKLLKSRRLMIEMGKKGRETVLKKLSWNFIGKQYSSLFNKIAGKIKFYSLGVPKILDKEGRIKIANQIKSVLLIDLKKKNTKNLNLLDCGCSSGIIANFLAKDFKRVVGIDIDRYAIKKAKLHQRSNLSFQVMDAEKMDFKDGIFDVVVCNQVYNFVNDPKKLIAEINRVLKNGGICFFGARNKLALIEPQYNKLFLSWFSRKLPFGKNYLNYFQLKKLVSKFILRDYTLRILAEPSKYGFKALEKYSFLVKLLPEELVIPFIPNYIWILEKNEI